jgi:hypothetical protein
MKNLVLITSVVNITKNPLSYTNTRSFCNMEYRFNDTIKTIESIKKYIPNSSILLVECSDIDEENENILKKHVDYYINLFSNKYILEKTQTISKSLGEGVMTIEAIKYILNNIDYNNFNNLFKISGRYWLNDNFYYNLYDNKNIVVKKIENSEDNILTCFYKIPINKIINLLHFLNDSHQEFYNCIGYEVIFAKFIKITENIYYIEDKVGINGYVSVCGTFVDI